MAKYIILIFLGIGFIFNACNLSAQCTPPHSHNCDDASALILCGLTALNGLSCSNTSTNPSPCTPVCSQGGVGDNTSWWAFTTNGGSASITLSVGTCANSQGLEFGIWGNCSCGDEIVCRSNPCTLPGTSNTVSFNTVACKRYYFWVDGCNADVCDFTITTTGGAPPTLSSLGKINNESDLIIDVCENACFRFFVDAPNSNCKIDYEWTWDGVALPQYKTNSFETDVSQAVGDYTICVTAFISLENNIICASQGPQCATVKIRRLPERSGPKRILCYEQVNPSGFKWHSRRIYSSGVYTHPFSNGQCCSFDSIVEFEVMELPQPAEVYYITCDNKPYTDVSGKIHYPCRFQNTIFLPKSTLKYQCDSSIILTAINVNYEPTWESQCSNGMVELNPNIKIIKPCNAGESYEFEYKWYKKSDSLNVLSTDERLTVNAISEDYCIEVKVLTRLGNELTICSRIFCENINEDTLAPECSFNILSDQIFCFKRTGNYTAGDIVNPNVNSYIWTVDGGSVISIPDSSSISINWIIQPGDTGKVCLAYRGDCGLSCNKCVDVFFNNNIAGQNFQKQGLSAYLDAIYEPKGTWRLISGPYPVRIEDPNYPRTKITAYNYGYYCFEYTISDPNCTVKDTQCVELHSFPKASPEYPKLLFFERGRSKSEQKYVQFFTPNIISSKGYSHMTLSTPNTGNMQYHWMNFTGQVMMSGYNVLSANSNELRINAPTQAGLYFLLFVIDGEKQMVKVCVMNQ